MKYTGQGAINAEMLKKCKLYFRREKPYIQGILPLPYGIERTYIPKNMIPLRDRKYDIFCVFGQRMYPPLREEIYNFLKRTYASNLLWNKSTALPFFGGHNIFSRYRFYKKMSESKLGISVSGGGYDTARFWEILGSGALLVTQKIDIDFPQGISLPHKHVFQFTSMDDFTGALDTALHTAYSLSCDEYQKNYEEICRNHSSEARIRYVLRAMGL